MTEDIKEALRSQPRRVKEHPDLHGGQPHIHRKEITVITILEMLESGSSYETIKRKYPNINDQDIDACRVYQAELITRTLKSEFGKHKQPFFMLDENTSYFLLPDVIRMFGPSTHVFSEGLFNDNNDDEKHIWEYMVKNHYRAILTMDNDFKRISLKQRHRLAEKYGSLHECPEHIPAVISIATDNTHQSISRLLKKHQKAITDMVTQKSVFFSVLTEQGLIVPPYRDFHSHLTPQNCSSLTPS